MLCSGSQHSPSRWQLLVILLLVSLCLASLREGWAQEKGRIQGVVRQQDKAISEHRIMLIRFGPGQQDVNRTPGQTDADGRFVFDDLETGSEYSYVVGIRYDDQLYRSASMTLETGQTRDDVVVEVGAQGTRATEGEGPAGPAGIHIGQHMVAVAFRDDHLEVREVISIRHPGPAPYEGPGDGKTKSPYVLHLPLPDGYYNIRGLQGLDQAHIRSDSAGLYYMAPLSPGTHRVLYTYALPMLDTVTTLIFPRTLPTVIFDMLIDAEHLVATSDLQFLGRVPIESHNFLHFRGANPQPNSRSWLQVTRVVTGTTELVRASSYVLIIGLALLGILIPVYGLWKRRLPTAVEVPVTPEQIQQWQTDRQRLVTAIAKLDDDRAAETLAETDYYPQRQALKQQLLEVARQLHTAQNGHHEQPLVQPSGSPPAVRVSQGN